MQTNTKHGKRKGLGDHHFRSTTEADFARYLKYFERLDYEYETVDLFFDKIKRGTRSYRLDFSIPALDIHVEVKGYLDAKSLTRLKRCRIYYPEVFQKLWLVKQSLSDKDKEELKKIGFPLERTIDFAHVFAFKDELPEWESRPPTKKAQRLVETFGKPLLSEIVQNSRHRQGVSCVKKVAAQTKPTTKEDQWPRNEQHDETPKKQKRKVPLRKKKSSTTKMLKKRKSLTKKTSTKKTKVSGKKRTTLKTKKANGKVTKTKKVMRKKKATKRSSNHL